MDMRLLKKVEIKIYKTTILPTVLFGCKTWSLQLKKEHRLREFEKWMLRIFVHERDDIM
jgi:hypothetical protein